MPHAMKIPAAKAAVDKEWEKLEKIPAWDLTKIRSKSEVIDEAKTKAAKVHFASLMDICHLKNAELETKHQKYKGCNKEQEKNELWQSRSRRWTWSRRLRQAFLQRRVRVHQIVRGYSEHPVNKVIIS